MAEAHPSLTSNQAEADADLHMVGTSGGTFESAEKVKQSRFPAGSWGIRELGTDHLPIRIVTCEEHQRDASTMKCRRQLEGRAVVQQDIQDGTINPLVTKPVQGRSIAVKRPRH
jgi:hypothetical protein